MRFRPSGHLLWCPDPLTSTETSGGYYETLSILSTTLVISIVSLAGCEIAGDIFKAGVWVGAILVIGIIGLVIWMLTKAGS